MKNRHGLSYGWIMLLVVSFTEMVSWGVLYYAFTIFLEPMQRSLGWSTAELTGAFSLALLCSGVAALPFGHWLDRSGARLLMTTGSCAACLLVLQYDVHPFVGLSIGPITFLVCVLGGLGNFVGGFVAAFVFAEIISLGGLFSDLEWGYVLAFGFFIVMMFIRPAGLLARRR